MTEAVTKQDLIAALAVFKHEFKTELTASLKTELTTWLEVRFQEERAYVRSQLDEERLYYAQLVRDELSGLRQQLERIEQQIGGDARGALLELDAVKRRLSELEATVAKLQAA